MVIFILWLIRVCRNWEIKVWYNLGVMRIINYRKCYCMEEKRKVGGGFGWSFGFVIANWS